MPLTDSQLDEKVRTIAESIGMSQPIITDYAKSTDAILDVVLEYLRLFPYNFHNWGISGTTDRGLFKARILGAKVFDTTPARALCMALIEAFSKEERVSL